MLDIRTSTSFDKLEPEICTILNHQEQTEFTSFPPRGLMRPIPIRLTSFPCNNVDRSFELLDSTPTSTASVENVRMALGEVGGGDGGIRQSLSDRIPRLMFDTQTPSTFDEIDPEVRAIFSHEELPEFVSFPPRGLLRPIPIPLQSALSRDEDSGTCATFSCEGPVSPCRDAHRSDVHIGGGDDVTGHVLYKVSAVTQTKSCGQMDISEKPSSKQSVPEKNNTFQSLFDRFRKFLKKNII